METVERAQGQRVASVDIGSNSVLVLVADWDGVQGRWMVVEDMARITRISEGLDARGSLAPGPVARTRAELEEMMRRARELGVREVIATGTAPFRRARNGLEVAAALEEVLGCRLEVVSGEEEATLALEATLGSFPELERPVVVVVDIGGASTEVITWRKEQAGGAEVISLDIGAVRLHERCVARDPITPEEVEAIRTQVRVTIEGLDLEVCPAPGRDGVPQMIGIAGTVTTLAAMAQKMEVYQADKIQGSRLSRRALKDTIQALINRTVEERKTLPGLQPGRADVILAGALLLEVLMERLGVEEVLVSDRGLRWGRLLRLKFGAPGADEAT